MIVEINVGDTSVPYELFEMPLDLSRRQAPGIQAHHLLVKAFQPALTLGHELRRKAPLAIARDRKGQRPRLGLHRLLTRAVAGVPLLAPVADMRGIAQVGRQLGFQHPLYHPFGQLLQQAMLAQNILRVGIVFEQFV